MGLGYLPSLQPFHQPLLLLGMASFGLRMLYPAIPRVKLIVMRFHLAAILRATVGEHPDYPHIMGRKQG